MIEDREFKLRTMAAFTAVYIIWGSTYLAIRFTIETIPTFLSAGLRFLLPGVLLYAWARFKNKEASPSLENWLAACLIGGLLLLGGNGCVVWAEHYVPSGVAALFIAIVPLWMVLLEWWTVKRRPSLGVFLGIAIGFYGVWLLMSPALFHRGIHGIPLKGASLLLLASISWSIGSVYSRHAQLPKSPFMSTGMQMMGGSVLLLVVGLLNGEANHLHAFSLKSSLALLYLITFGSLIAFSSYIWLLKNVGVARTATYAFVNPVVALILGYAWAGEKMDAQTMIAALFVLVAVIVITLYHKEHGKNNQPAK